MAIKGKSKARGTRRAVTRGPKPVYTPVKRPLLARRGFQIGAAIVLVLGSGLGIWYGLAREHNQQQERAVARRQRAAMGQVQGTIDNALLNVGQKVPPANFEVLPNLKRDLDGFASGDVTADQAEKTGKEAADSARLASDAIGGFSVSDIIRDKGFPPEVVVWALDAQTKMVNALDLYQQAAILLRHAAGAEGQARDDLLESASSVLDVATRLFGEGYGDYVNAQNKAGTFTPTLTQP